MAFVVAQVMLGALVAIDLDAQRKNGARSAAIAKWATDWGEARPTSVISRESHRK
jgi:hypothetical protein